MPLYDFQCLQCNNEFEFVCKIEEREYVKCKCGGSTKQIIKKFPNQDWFHPHWNEDFTDKPVFVRTKNHYKQLCEQHGVYSKALGFGRNLKEI